MTSDTATPRHPDATGTQPVLVKVVYRTRWRLIARALAWLLRQHVSLWAGRTTTPRIWR